jgi:23S rRNA pseudouridine1911/1915/1917 synthase
MTELSVEIIYQDEQVLVINKPSGVSTTTDRSGTMYLKELLREKLPRESLESIPLVHRLDKDTSGVMVLAKTKAAQTQYYGFFENGQVRKIYLALVTGRPQSTIYEPLGQMSGTIDAAIAPVSENQNIMRIDHKKGKPAVTGWQVIADFGTVLLLAVSPQTSRTHQIRVHLPSIGLNLAVDLLYGSGRGIFLSDFKKRYKLGRGQEEKPLIDRLTLHAYQIEFLHPTPDTPSVFVAGLDKSFKAAIKMLTKYNHKGPAAFLQPDVYQKILDAQKI